MEDFLTKVAPDFGSEFAADEHHQRLEAGHKRYCFKG